MSFNFSIDSILGHDDNEASNPSGSNGNGSFGSDLSAASRLSYFHKNLSALSAQLELNAVAAATVAAATAPTSNDIRNSSNIGGTVQFSSSNSAATSSQFHYELNQLSQLNQLNQLSQLARYHYLQRFQSLYNTAAATSTGSGNVLAGSNETNLVSIGNNINESNEGRCSGDSLASMKLEATLNNNAGQCSPISDQSLKLILNYENRLEHHHRSGRNMTSAARTKQKESICSSNSSVSNESENVTMLHQDTFGSKSNMTESDSANNKEIIVVNGDGSDVGGFGQFGNKDAPLCTKCKLHGIRSQVKGHKKNCPMKDCGCELCVLTDYGKRLRGKKAKKVTPEVPIGSHSAPILGGFGTPVAVNGFSAPDSHITTPDFLRFPANLSLMSVPSTISSTLKADSFQSLPSKQDSKENAKLVLSLLRDRMHKDGLDYEQELSKLKDTVMFILLNQFEKNDLYTKFMSEL